MLLQGSMISVEDSGRFSCFEATSRFPQFRQIFESFLYSSAILDLFESAVSYNPRHLESSRLQKAGREMDFVRQKRLQCMWGHRRE